MATLKYFTPVLRYLSVVADAPVTIGGDADADPDSNGLYGGVTVIPAIIGADAPSERAIRAISLTPPALLAVAPIEARLDNGDLKLTADQRLRLVATCPALGLTGDQKLVYSFSFHDVRYNQQEQLLPSITVQAPSVPENHDDNVPTPGASEVLLNLATATWLQA